MSASTRTRQATGPAPTGWVGWIMFAAFMLITVGAFNVIDGLVAIFKDEVFVTTGNRLIAFDLTTWGWITLLFGAAQLLAGVALFRGSGWARPVAVVLVILNAIAQLTFLTAFPVWATIVIAMDVLVLWALIVHGDEVSAL